MTLNAKSFSGMADSVDCDDWWGESVRRYTALIYGNGNAVHRGAVQRYLIVDATQISYLVVGNDGFRPGCNVKIQCPRHRLHCTCEST